MSGVVGTTDESHGSRLGGALLAGLWCDGEGLDLATDLEISLLLSGSTSMKLTRS
jgi:hypothetical protein